MNVYTLHVRTLIEYASSLWNVGYLGDVRLLERIQRRWTREVSGLGVLFYGERLKRFDLFSFQGRLLRTNLIIVYKILHNKCAIGVEEVFLLNRFSNTRGHQLNCLNQELSQNAGGGYFHPE